jgi:hypothetical protein
MGLVALGCVLSATSIGKYAVLSTHSMYVETKEHHRVFVRVDSSRS